MAMETTSSSQPISYETTENHTHHIPTSYHHLHSGKSHEHHHGILSFDSIILIVVSIISAIVIFTIILIVALLRRLKSAKNRADSCIDLSSFNGNSCKSSNRFPVHTTINFSSSPDVKGGEGCLHGGQIISAAPSSRFNNNDNKKGVQVFTYKELEMATNKFNEENVIGDGGGFGIVYKGVLSDGSLAAIKKLNRDGKQGERAFRMEVDLLSRLHSPYLVELLGYCADQHHRLLISEYMPNGTLKHHLHHPESQYQPLDWRTRLMIALDCARALEFLHEVAMPPIIHRDFKCTNVLLNQNFRAKVSDFGLAKMVSDKINGHISTRVLGTTGYLAPEYASTGKLTTKSDVYSYGVVLLELLTGRVPVDANRPLGEHALVSWALPRLTNREKVLGMVDPSLHGQYSKKDLIQVAAIAAMCVQAEADYRPLMTDVVQSLIPLVKNNSSTISSRSSRFLHQSPSPRY